MTIKSSFWLWVYFGEIRKFKHFIERSDWDNKLIRLYEKSSIVLIPVAILAASWLLIVTLWFVGTPPVKTGVVEGRELQNHKRLIKKHGLVVPTQEPDGKWYFERDGKKCLVM